MKVPVIGANDKTHLRGSKSRDTMRFWHKQPPIPKNFYASDIDFILVEKYPPHVAAILDWKCPGDQVTFTECIAMNDFMNKGYLCYIIWGEHEESVPGKPVLIRADIYRYLGGNYRPEPPEIRTERVCQIENEAEWIRWERTVRNAKENL